MSCASAMATSMKVSPCNGMDLQDYKIALSLNEMLNSTGQGRQPTASTLPATSERASAGSSESGADDDSTSNAKRNFQPYHSQIVPRSENLEAHASDCVTNGTVTTMMLRNIPNKYTQTSLLKEINEVGFGGTYDFFYLPMDVHNRSNVGYAFINFEMPQDAERFRRAFSDHRFQRFHSRKIGSVCVAHVQGLDANLRHFENRAVTQARNDQYRPIVLQGQQRLDFDHAVGLAKARGGAARKAGPPAGYSAPQPAEAAVIQPDKAEENPRQGLEAAIRELITKRAATPKVAAAPVGVPLSPTMVDQRGCRGREEADIAQLLSLRNLLINQLHTNKDGPAYVNPSMDFYAAAWSH
mmetsp:Transcript_118321/g.314895  ORF Transcript_118321/g.314895 Transcript_118321/m.314895 type:complete len:354 (-) Transcript_118321:322-1383(-)